MVLEIQEGRERRCRVSG